MRDTLRELLFSRTDQSHRLPDSESIEETLAASSTTVRETNNSTRAQHPARRRDTSSKMMTPTLVRARQTNSHFLKLSPITQITKEQRYLTRRRRRNNMCLLPVALCLVVALAALGGGGRMVQAGEEKQQQQIDLRSTQPTLDRQVETPGSGGGPSSSSSSGAQQSSASTASSSVKPSAAGDKPAPHQSTKPQKPIVSLASQKKAAALAAQRDYDKYQLKASPSSHSPSSQSAAQSSSATAATATTKPSGGQDKEKEKEKEREKAIGVNNESGKSSSGESGSVQAPAHKKIGQHPHTRQPSSAFSLLKKFLPSFMTSGAGPAVAAAAAAASAAVADKQQHSRSSPSSAGVGPGSLLSSLLSSSSGSGSSSSGAGGKIINLLSGASKKRNGIPEGALSAIPNHAPFFMRKSAADRQAGGGGALALASGLLSNPLKLGLLFSAPLLPSLLLTPLAIAGLSPAMSAINNFFGDDDEPATASQSPLAAFASGPNSPLASILQATGASPFGSSPSSSSSSGSSSGESGSASSPANNFALQAFQSFLTGPTSTTERPLFNPGMFASSGIQNAAGALGSALSSSSNSNSGGSSSSSGNSGQSRPFFGGGGGGLMQAAASMISPSFAAPPSSSSSSSDDDGPGLMQMASDVFEKVANYMGTDNKDGQPAAAASNSIGQASGGQPGAPANSPLSTLASLSSLSPFQLSSLFASTPLGSALAGSSSKPAQASGASLSSTGGGAGTTQRAGFFSTLRNVYELFSSSFLRRQEVGNENECQQRLVCELHQRAMNSKFFKRSLQANLNELANLDKNLIEQIKYSSQALQARVDPDTKAMLSDFLKATNNFKSGREMINCSQMFPKCTRTQLLAAVNAHMSDPVNGRAIGKFSQLMKKMKYKSNQQHQSQWKLRKPSAKSVGAGSIAISPMTAGSVPPPPMDYLQVAPLNKAGQATNGQLTPVDSLKLAQQIMMLSQMSSQQQQQSSISPVISQYVSNGNSNVAQQQYGNQYSNQQQSGQSQPAGYSASPYIGANYSPAPTRQTTYTDAIMPSLYSATDSPYFIPAQMGSNSQQQQQQYVSEQQNGQTQQYSQQQQPNQPSQSIVSTQQQYTQTGQMGPSSQLAQDQQTMNQQQQSVQGSSNMDNKNQPQQLLTPKKSSVAVAA